MRLDSKISRLAIPSKGRLQDEAQSLLKAAGITYRRRDRALMAHAASLDLMVLFVRPDDIPVLVAEGAAASTVGALLEGLVRASPDTRVVCVLSGGNLDVEKLRGMGWN